MTAVEFKELVGAYALGALDADERAALEAFMASPACDASCRQALAEARRTVAALPAALPPLRPSPGSWAAIERAIGGADAAPAPRPTRAMPWVVAIVAAAAVLVVWLRGRERVRELEDTIVAQRGTASQLGEKLTTSEKALTAAVTAKQQCETRLDDAEAQLALRQEAVALLEHPATQVVTFEALADEAKGGGAAAIMNVAEKKGYIVGSGMAKPAGKDYELWVVVGKDVRAAGLLRGAEGTGQLVAAVDPAVLEGGPEALVITLEPEGGGPVARGPAVMKAVMKK